MPLTLDRQNAYRDRYRALRPGWQPATAVYEARVRAALAGYASPTLLDLGCGRGGALEQLADASRDLRPFGVDPDFASLAEHRLPDLPRAVATADALPVRAATADVVIAAWVLEHLPDPARTFAEVARVLRPAGAFVFVTPNRRSPVVLLNRLLRPLQSRLVPRLYGRAEADTFPVLYRANTGPRLEALAAAAGMRLATLTIVEDPTYLAFNEALFWLNRQIARRLPESTGVHLVGVCRKEGA